MGVLELYNKGLRGRECLVTWRCERRPEEAGASSAAQDDNFGWVTKCSPCSRAGMGEVDMEI